MGFFKNLGKEATKTFHSVGHVIEKGADGIGGLAKKAIHKGSIFDQAFQTGKQLITAPTKLLQQSVGSVEGLLKNPIFLIGALAIGGIVINKYL